ncbi:UPF0160 protein [Cucumispora dikerogammari]|nr:UPF0160 protein [Cucumispora dikerogammari]
MFLITTGGPFFCCEVTATAILTLINKNCIIFRTRDTKLIQLIMDSKINQSEHNRFFKKYLKLQSNKSTTIVYNTLGTYNPLKNIYDHHQPNFTKSFYDTKFKYVKMCSASMIFKHYNKQLIKSIMEDCKVFESININEFLESNKYKDLIEHVYENYFLNIDANEHAIQNSSVTPFTNRPWQDVINIYNDYSSFGDPTAYTLQDISTDFLQYNKISGTKLNEEKKREKSFNYAVKVCREDLELYLRRKIYTFSIEYEKILKKISLVEEFEEGKVVYWKQLDDKCQDVGEDLTFIKRLQIKHLPKARFFIYEPKKEGDMFRIYGALADYKTLKNKAYLKVDWRGLRDKELIEVSSFKKIGFVHANGFTGGAYDFETALKMCIESL